MEWVPHGQVARDRKGENAKQTTSTETREPEWGKPTGSNSTNYRQHDKRD